MPIIGKFTETLLLCRVPGLGRVSKEQCAARCSIFQDPECNSCKGPETFLEYLCRECGGMPELMRDDNFINACAFDYSGKS